MKIFKILIYLICLFETLQINSQIKIKEIIQREDTVVSKPKNYDGISDFQFHENIEDYKQYIGYDIFVLPTMTLFSEKTTTFEEYDTYIYKPINTEFISNNSPSYVTSDTLYSNRTLKIIDISDDYEKDSIISMIQKSSYRNAYLNSGFERSKIYGTYFKLKDTITNEIFYTSLKISEDNDRVYGASEDYKKIKFNKSHSDFIFVPFFEFLKNKYNNKVMIMMRGEGYVSGDIYSKKNINRLNKQFSKWKCKVEVVNLKKDLIVNTPSSRINPSEYAEQDTKIFFLLTNEFEETIATPDLINYDFVFVSKEEYDLIKIEEKLNALQKEQKKKDLIASNQKRLKAEKIELEKKYGLEIATLIVTNNVKIGLNKEICKLSWGKPLSKNETINSNGNYEIWYYWGNSSLTFLNNKLIQINK